ncbi:MAG: hypothetical protein KJ023_23740, partial [Burkholderiaceae bacterium]|nr:hypothetical protein [Burkholderiaceae bacterium]
VAEVQRFINVPRRWCEQYPARERRELWITADQGPEFKFVVHTSLMPARRGHRVLALLMGRELVALHNLQTGESVNYLRSDPPLLWRRCEVVIAVLAVVGGIAAFVVVGGVVPLAVVAATLIGAPGAVAMRRLARSLAKRATDRALIEAVRQAAAARAPTSDRPTLRRVK